MSEILSAGYGRILAEAREAQGLTVIQVADKLKLTSRQIEAIEAEDAERLPEPVFIRGFVRNYARLLGVPLESLPVIASVPVTPTETITAHSEEVRLRTSPVRRWLVLPAAGFILFLVLVAALYAWLSQGEEAYVPAAPPVTSQPLPAPEPVAPGVPQGAADVPDGAVSAPVEPATPAGPGANPMTPAAPVSTGTAPGGSAQAAPPQPAPAKTIPAPQAPAAAPSQVASPAFGVPVFTGAPRAPAAPAAAPPAAAAPAPASAPAVSTPHTVQLVAEQNDSWIQVVSGDDKRYSRLLRTGEQLTLRGAAPFRLVIGDAEGVRLRYDGRAIDLKPYTGEKVARLSLE